MLNTGIPTRIGKNIEAMILRAELIIMVFETINQKPAEINLWPFSPHTGSQKSRGLHICGPENPIRVKMAVFILPPLFLVVDVFIKCYPID